MEVNAAYGDHAEGEANDGTDDQDEKQENEDANQGQDHSATA